ncbi:MAG: type I DNA topoisomerase [Bacteroidetes bacterium]|nr:type I DNA topoisomerase [Bacteroidota bacterium]
MTKNLVIVESPAKAKTIEKFLGKDFTVKSCFGHIRDLIKGDQAIDVKAGYQPKYEVPAEKKAVVSELKKLAKDSEIIWLASDEDREGEAISWHLFEVLKLDKSKTRRIVFHEITKPAILKAIENPRDIDEHLVDAQQARRILDRLVGFELSPVLWKKVKPSLSAGRVQSVAVRLVVEREREIDSFEVSSSYKVVGTFVQDGKSFQAEANSTFTTEEKATEFLKTCVGALYSVTGIEVKPVTKKPAPPFTTSTLQQEASRKLGYSVSRTMSVAQKLYENGHITYMRTDSVNLSGLALNAAKQEIVGQYGESYSKVRNYTTKSAGAQEAHEAIRPTYFDRRTAGEDASEEKLYDLIWKRAIASQMSDAIAERTIVKIKNDRNETIFTANGEVLKFDGFLKVYLEGHDDDEDEETAGLLPPIKEGDHPNAEALVATQRFTRPPGRYTEASLVRKLEELGIGRPSTYAPTISTIQKRGYVEKGTKEGEERQYTVLTLKGSDIQKKIQKENTGSDKGRLVPSDIGKIVTDFLIAHFDKIMDYRFTANVEKEFDEIASGLKEWNKMIDEFYHPFHKTVDNTLDSADRATGERYLGDEPGSGKRVIARMGRFGPMIQIGEAEGDEKPRFASLPKGQSIENISLEEALELFRLPRVVGKFEDKDMKVAIGRFGPYVQHSGSFYSLAKTDDPLTIDTDRAIEIILDKRKRDAERIIKQFAEDETLEILNGRWGPYISQGKNNFKLPKNVEPATLTYNEVLDIIKNQPVKKGKAKPAAKAKAKVKKK